MIKTTKKVKFMKFLFRNIAFIVVIVYGYYIVSTTILDSIGNKLFSDIANKYSADYIFNDNYKDHNEINRIKELGGWIFELNDNFSLNYISDEKVPKKYELKDIIDLNKGIYNYNNIKYFGSVKKITNNYKDKYGVVVVPAKVISYQVLLTPQKQNLGYFILFFILRSIIFIFGTAIVISVFSKILHGKLYRPLYELENGFKRLKEDDYSILLDPTNDSKIIEFSYIKKAFNAMVRSLVELKNERLENQKKRIQLFADIRHDLKTPITVIKGFSEALISRKIPEKEAQKYLEAINKNTIAINTLLNELSEIIEYENYDYNLKLETLDFCEYIRQSIIEFLPVFEQKNMKIKIQIPDEEILTKIDKNIFSRALNNLMKNIIDHNEMNTKVYFKVKNGKNKVILIIQDTGTKIHKKIVGNIFDPFVTSDSSRNTSIKNRGLGLSITKKIIELHKGQIFLDSNGVGDITKSFIIELKK